MTLHQKELVVNSFTKIGPIAEETGELFFSRLFEIAPYVRPLFKEDLKVMGMKFMQSLAVIVSNLDKMETVTPVLQKLGREHRSYGVTTGHFDIAASALLWTLERCLGGDFTDEVRNAWISLYTLVSGIMKKAADDVSLAA
ncbi:MAG: globin domain-containing protein [Bacteroidota bacterium]